jgi:DNA-binding transcriptional LysR family regulator
LSYIHQESIEFISCSMNDIQLARIDLNLLVTFEVLMSEGSVTRAAARLSRTPSAISHSLARLREQVGDPLMVKTGSGMAPSPFAQSLVAEVRPILRNLQRIVSPPVAFDPSTSTRLFRAAIADVVPTLLPRVLAEVQRQAPGVTVEWLAPSAATIAAVADEQIDLSLVESRTQLPAGVRRADVGEAPRVLTFARKGHPGIPNWGAAAWKRWPHIVVQLGERVRSMVEIAAQRHGVERTIGATVPNFSQIPALLSQTNLLATMTPMVVDGAMAHHGLVALEPPMPINPSAFSFIWGFRLENDPGSRWFRTLVMRVYDELQTSVAAQAATWSIVKAGKSRRPRS